MPHTVDRGSLSPRLSRCSRHRCRNRAGSEISNPRRHLCRAVPPGGSADALPRIVAEKLRERWGQPVVIENRPGAAGSTGSGSVFRAPPDGYTLLATPAGPLAINGLVQKTLPYDAWQRSSRLRCWRCRRPC